MSEPSGRGGTAAAVRTALLLAGAAAVLTACGVAPTRERDAQPTPRPGGYYLDDGPHDNPPVNLDQVADAVPRIEPIRAANTRPYTAMGKTYVPMLALAPYRATGHASWYGKRYHGKPTASGEPYDMYAMTAAHPILPIPSYARVRNLSNERSVVVRINDRGPFHADREIDLSYTAAYKLGILADGRALVQVESILPGTNAGAPLQAAASEPPAAPARAPSAGEAAPGVYVQLGAFSEPDNAQSFLTRVQSELTWLAAAAGVYRGDGLYRVQAGPYADRGTAARTAELIEQALQFKPIIVSR